MDRIEPQIGEIFEIDGQKYVCKEQINGETCRRCAFLKWSSCPARCCDSTRQDGKEVYFELATGENAEQKANAMEEEKHKIGIAVGEAIREEAITQAAVEVLQREEKARNDIEEENQSILNYLRDFLLRHHSRITEVKVASEPLHLGLGKLVEVPADRIIIVLKPGTQE